jgi:hypothetical protein
VQLQGFKTIVCHSGKKGLELNKNSIVEQIKRLALKINRFLEKI